VQLAVKEGPAEVYWLARACRPGFAQREDLEDRNNCYVQAALLTYLNIIIWSLIGSVKKQFIAVEANIELEAAPRPVQVDFRAPRSWRREVD
jgi:hypothetical protein